MLYYVKNYIKLDYFACYSIICHLDLLLINLKFINYENYQRRNTSKIYWGNQ